MDYESLRRYPKARPHARRYARSELEYEPSFYFQSRSARSSPPSGTNFSPKRSSIYMTYRKNLLYDKFDPGIYHQPLHDFAHEGYKGRGGILFSRDIAGRSRPYGHMSNKLSYPSDIPRHRNVNLPLRRIPNQKFTEVHSPNSFSFNSQVPDRCLRSEHLPEGYGYRRDFSERAGFTRGYASVVDGYQHPRYMISARDVPQESDHDGYDGYGEARSMPRGNSYGNTRLASPVTRYWKDFYPRKEPQRYTFPSKEMVHDHDTICKERHGMKEASIAPDTFPPEVEMFSTPGLSTAHLPDQYSFSLDALEEPEEEDLELKPPLHPIHTRPTKSANRSEKEFYLVRPLPGSDKVQEVFVPSTSCEELDSSVCSTSNSDAEVEDLLIRRPVHLKPWASPKFVEEIFNNDTDYYDATSSIDKIFEDGSNACKSPTYERAYEAQKHDSPMAADCTFSHDTSQLNIHFSNSGEQTRSSTKISRPQEEVMARIGKAFWSSKTKESELANGLGKSSNLENDDFGIKANAVNVIPDPKHGEQTQDCDLHPQGEDDHFVSGEMECEDSSCDIPTPPLNPDVHVDEVDLGTYQNDDTQFYSGKARNEGDKSSESNEQDVDYCVSEQLKDLETLLQLELENISGLMENNLASKVNNSIKADEKQSTGDQDETTMEERSTWGDGVDEVEEGRELSSDYVYFIFYIIVSKIQACYRGHAVRTSNILDRLRAIKRIKTRLHTLKSQFHNNDEENHCVIVPEQMMECTMSLLLELDSVKGTHPFIREMRKHVAKEIVDLQDKLEFLATEQSSLKDSQVSNEDTLASESPSLGSREIQSSTMSEDVESDVIISEISEPTSCPSLSDLSTNHVATPTQEVENPLKVPNSLDGSTDTTTSSPKKGDGSDECYQLENSQPSEGRILSSSGNHILSTSPSPETLEAVNCSETEDKKREATEKPSAQLDTMDYTSTERIHVNVSNDVVGGEILSKVNQVGDQEETKDTFKSEYASFIIDHNFDDLELHHDSQEVFTTNEIATKRIPPTNSLPDLASTDEDTRSSPTCQTAKENNHKNFDQIDINAMPSQEPAESKNNNDGKQEFESANSDPADETEDSETDTNSMTVSRSRSPGTGVQAPTATNSIDLRSLSPPSQSCSLNGEEGALQRWDLFSPRRLDMSSSVTSEEQDTMVMTKLIEENRMLRSMFAEYSRKSCDQKGVMQELLERLGKLERVVKDREQRKEKRKKLKKMVKSRVL